MLDGVAMRTKVDVDGSGTTAAPRHKKSGNAQSFSELIWFNSKSVLNNYEDRCGKLIEI